MSMNVADMIQAYASDPIAQYEMTEYDCTYTQWNSLCGDSITVFLQLSDDKQTITDFSHAWAPQMFTLAAASMLAEEIIWKKIATVMERGWSYMEWLWLVVSPRRKRSTVSALLAVHNCLVKHLWKGQELDYEEILSL